MTDAAPSVEEIRAATARHGLRPSDADLQGVHDFLAVFLPAIDRLAGLLPPDGSTAGPSPLGPE